ncbi:MULTISPECIES: recombinase family protein [Enterobacter]|uniref:recombinase family protein n=1 Tax=Enterobacter TaxID=547 RepID=UPI001E40D55A|nr:MULTISPECIES: recombinase family protein [Enterobacter]
MLLVWKLNWLGCSLSHLIRIIEDLRNWGFALKSLTKAIDITTPYGSFLFNLFGTLAEYERTLSPNVLM